MFKGILTFAGLLFSLLLMVNSSWAAEVSLLNSNFERLRGKSIPYEVEFLAKEGVGTLLLNNGDGDGNYCISSATVYLNGEAIITPDDMKQDVPQVSREVYLNTQNLLVVELTSAPDSFIDISVKQEVFADAEKVIGLDGGVIEVTEPESPIFGVSLDVPSGALTEPVQMTVTVVETSPETPEGIAFTGQMIDLQPEGLAFAKPVVLTLKYSDSNDDGIIDGTVIDEEFVNAGYFNEATQDWEQLEVIAKDFQSNTVSVITNHFSIYSAFTSDVEGIPQQTQSISQSITIDGDPSDWDLLNPTLPNADLPNDSTCYDAAPGTDFMEVYTALDDQVDPQFAYVMIKYHDTPQDQAGNWLFPDMTFQVDVDVRPGNDLVNSAYGDLNLKFHKFEDEDVTGPNGRNSWLCLWNDFVGDENSYIDVCNYFVEGASIEYEVGEVFEAKIPLSIITDKIGAIDYFNFTNYYSYYQNWNNTCDVDTMYPKINWFRAQKRLHDDREDYARFVFSQTTREGKYLSDPDYITNVKITLPDNYNSISLTGDNFTGWTENSAYGNYNPGSNSYHYGSYSYESGFQKKYFTGEEFYQTFEEQIGTYLISLSDTSGKVYETSYEVTRTDDLPAVDSSTVNCFKGSEENLTCEWSYPDFDAIEEGLEPQLSALPHFIARQSVVDEFGNESYKLIRVLRVGLRYVPETELNSPHRGHLPNKIIMPSDVWMQLIEGADKLDFAVRTRFRNDNVRSYSAEINILPVLQ